MHGKEFGIGAVLDGAFAVAVDEDGALLGLLSSVAADVDEGLDDVVEGVHVVVPEYQLAAVVFEDGGFVFRLGAYIWFILFQFQFSIQKCYGLGRDAFFAALEA